MTDQGAYQEFYHCDACDDDECDCGGGFWVWIDPADDDPFDVECPCCGASGDGVQP